MIKSSIVTYLDKELTDKVREVQKRLYELTGSRACLDLWGPHITVGSGVTIPDADEADFLKHLSTVAKEFTPFPVTIKDYDFMDNFSAGKTSGAYTPYVIYLGVVVNPELQHLAETIEEKVIKGRETYWHQQWPYNPHITLAFKDLNKEGFERAKKLLANKPFAGETTIDHVAIHRQNEKGVFEETDRFSFIG